MVQLESAQWLNLILEEWRTPKRNAKSDHMQRKSLTWLAKVMEERTENVPGCCRSLAHPRKPSGSDGKVPFERWRGRGHHVGRCVFGEQVWYRVGP